MLETLTKSEGMQEMNRLGSKGTPFFFLIDFEKKQPIVIPLSDLDPEILCYTINGSSNHENFMPNDESIDFYPREVPFDSYQERFNKVMEQIHFGNSYLLNLTFPTEIKTNITLKEIYTRAIAPYELWIKDQLVVFSPEPVVHIVDGKISTHPMKGTIDTTIPNAKSRLK
ncbi:MAG TPA: aminodeoxychorismate synthase component I, partial [Saprospiraceae bacterium]|nr:aminodeoxychorismate synthase component I [Saprospiraceae bacterium]